MPPKTPEPAKLPHPVRNGVGFFAAAFTALLRAFWPARPSAEEAEADQEEEMVEADGETDDPPHTRRGAVSQVAPYPIND